METLILVLIGLAAVGTIVFLLHRKSNHQCDECDRRGSCSTFQQEQEQEQEKPLVGTGQQPDQNHKD